MVPWPSDGTVQDSLDRFRYNMHNHLKVSDVYLVFDRYKEGSIKASTRTGRDQGASRAYTLMNSTTRLPSRKVILTFTTNKTQLIDLICIDLVLHKDDLKQHKLVVTGRDLISVELDSGVLISMPDMGTTHEEADTIIVQQVASVKPTNLP